MTEYQLRIVFVLVLCAPVAYLGVRFFITLVNNAVAGSKAPADKIAKARKGAGKKAPKDGNPPASAHAPSPERRRKRGRRA
jgi:hypothetical protein